MIKIKHFLVFFSILFSISFIGCGSDPIEKKKAAPKAQQAKKNVSNNKIVVNGIFPKDDNLQLFYSTPQHKGFGPKKVVSRKIKGSPKPQRILFPLAPRERVTKFRLDLSSNKAQNNITIQNITLQKPSGPLAWGREQILKTFKPNPFVTVNTPKKTWTTKVVGGKYDPFIVSPNIPAPAPAKKAPAKPKPAK